MDKTNSIQNVAIVGASGNLGTFITNALLQTARHVVTAVTREDSQSTFPDDVTIQKIDYEKPETLVNALRGQDALIITLSGRARIQEVEEKLVRAAGEAGVPWVLPNEWSPDSANEALANDVSLFGMKVATRKLIEDIGKSSYLAVVTGFWYEYSLGIPANYGIDMFNRTVTHFDEGETKISTSTWPQIGRAVAALLSLPVKSNDGPCLREFRNQMIYINSFTVSQKDMLASALRVTGTREDGWTIAKVPARDRFREGVEAVGRGEYSGYSKMLYTRLFFPDGSGDFEHNKGTSNGVLGLPQEDIDEATRVAFERQRGTRK